MLVVQVLFICVISFAGLAHGQTPTSSSSGPTCSNPALQMTPAFRQEVLDYINDARNTLKNGQLLLQNGEHALIPETMPELTWDCDVEDELHELAKYTCTIHIPPYENISWYVTTAYKPLAETFYSGLHNVDIVGYHANFLSQHTVYTGPYPQYYVSAIHDKAETVACALIDCLNTVTPNPYPYPINYFICKITPDVKFGEKIYEVSPSNANANFPPQDVICPNSYGLTIEHRRMILEKINAVRQLIQAGTYPLENGNNALQAVNLPNLVWDCDEEAQVHMDTVLPLCLPTATDPTIFETFIPSNNANFNTLSNGISAFLDQLFIQNPSLNFLSQDTTYSTPNSPALALSDQATTISCAASSCFDPTNYSSSLNFACRVKPATSINQQLYQHV